jgi:hypothetical protein
MLDEAAGCDDLVTGLRPATRGTKGKSVSRLASVGTTRLAKASSEGWRLRLRPNSCPAIEDFFECHLDCEQCLWILQEDGCIA